MRIVGKLSQEDLVHYALIGLRAEKERLDSFERSLAGRPAPAKSINGTRPRRTMSAAGRRRIAAAQKKRWADLKKAQA